MSRFISRPELDEAFPTGPVPPLLYAEVGDGPAFSIEKGRYRSRLNECYNWWADVLGLAAQRGWVATAVNYRFDARRRVGQQTGFQFVTHDRPLTRAEQATVERSISKLRQGRMPEVGFVSNEEYFSDLAELHGITDDEFLFSFDRDSD